MHKGYSDIQKQNSTHVKTDNKIKFTTIGNWNRLKYNTAMNVEGSREVLIKTYVSWSPVINIWLTLLRVFSAYLLCMSAVQKCVIMEYEEPCVQNGEENLYIKWKTNDHFAIEEIVIVNYWESIITKICILWLLIVISN